MHTQQLISLKLQSTEKSKQRRRKSAKNNEVAPRETCEKAKCVKVSNLAKKTIKKRTKPPQKIRQAGKYTRNGKMQKNKRMHPHKIAQYRCAHTIQMQN